MAHAKVQRTENHGMWFLDSGCSNHMTGNKNWFIELDESFNHTVCLGNNTAMPVHGKGSIRFQIQGITQIVSDIYFVPDLTNNLLSIGQLQENELVIIIKAGACRIYHPEKGKIVDTKMTLNQMFVVHAKLTSLPRQCLKVEDKNLEDLWHRRYGHINHKFITIMQKKQMVRGLPTLQDFTGICEVCNIGKRHRDNIPKKNH